MVSFKFRIAFLAVALIGNVVAKHIKGHRFLSHRNQCRPLLASTIQSISPSSTLPSAPGRSSSISIPAQTSPSAHTATAAIVEHTSTVPSTSTIKVAAVLSTSFTPNNVKAGIAGGDAYPYMKDHIGWWYDWSVTRHLSIGSYSLEI
jgi:hypothetical protein